MTSIHTFDTQTCLNPQAKQDTRERSLRNATSMAQWHPNGYLTEDWVDLCGYQDETLKMLLAHRALRPGCGRYLGVNDDPDVINANRLYFAEPLAAGLCDFRCDKWNDAIQSDWASGASILTFDGFASVSRVALTATLGPTLVCAKDRQKRFGQALLYINLSRRGKDNIPAYRAYLLESLGVDIPDSQFHSYTSKRVPMLSLWLRLGF